MSKNKDSKLEHITYQAIYIGKLQNQRNFWIAVSVGLSVILIWRIL